MCAGVSLLTACVVYPVLHTAHCPFHPQAVFTLLLGPFTFFDVQKTKYLQILTSLMRWIGESKKLPSYLLFSPLYLPPPPLQRSQANSQLASVSLPGPLTFPEGKEEAGALLAFYC